MRIALNALFLQTPANGSGQYLLHLLHSLKEVDQHNEYLLLGAKPIADNGSALTPFPYRVSPPPSPARRNENVEKVVWEQFTGPAAARKAGIDLFHVPYFAPPLFPRTPTVVTIHDVIPLRLPAYQAGTMVKSYMRLVAHAAHNATLIITVSQHARQDMMDALHLPAEHIRVTHEAAGDEYKPITDPSLLAQARARYGVGERYIFYLGGLDRRKNVPQLVRAFAHLYKQLEQPDLQLLISGNPDKQKGPFFPDPRPIAAELGVSAQVIDRVVCSNRTSLPEVVGDAAITLDPDDTQALVEAMRSVLTDSTRRDDLRARSLQ